MGIKSLTQTIKKHAPDAIHSDNLYKLSEALLKIKKEKEACDILNQFIIKYPNHKLIEKTKSKINEIQCN